METAYRNYFVATFLKSCRHLASMKVNCHLLVLQAFAQERVVALSFDDLWLEPSFSPYFREGL